MHRYRSSLVAIVTAVALLTGCAGTKIVASWVAPDHHKESVKKIFVLAVAANMSIRRSYEDEFAKRLKERGYEAIPGYLWAPDSIKLDKDALVARMHKEGVTHVLVTRLVSSKKIETQEQPTAVVSVGVSPYGPGWYGGWSTYYSVGYSSAVTETVTTMKDVVTLETNVYDTSRKEDDAIIWTGHSETWVDAPSSGKVNEVISALIARMHEEKVL